MSKTTRLPVALTIAGSDSGGGAGIQADLKTFAALGVHGTSAITCITSQNPRRVLAIEPCTPAIVRQQINAVFEEFHPRAIKTGMLYSAAIIREVSARLARSPRVPIIVDPVMISTSGTRLLNENALKALQKNLLPLAALVTPNLHEAAVIAERNLSSIDDLHSAAIELHRRFGCAVVVKGGHLRNSRLAVDVFYDGKNALLLKSPFVRGVKTHGTGCTYSAAVAAYLALGSDLRTAVTNAKRYITRAIARSQFADAHPVLNHSPQARTARR